MHLFCYDYFCLGRIHEMDNFIGIGYGIDIIQCQLRELGETREVEGLVIIETGGVKEDCLGTLHHEKSYCRWDHRERGRWNIGGLG